MLSNCPISKRRRATVAFLVATTFIMASAATTALAHPLGNFTINHFTRVEVGAERVRLRYIVDMAEIPAFQELQRADANADGATSKAELDAYLSRIAPQYAAGLLLEVDGALVPLDLVSQTITTPPGVGNLPTLRVECTYEGAMPTDDAGAVRRLRFENVNHRERTGWREIVVVPASGVVIFNTTAYGSPVTDEIKAYPEDLLTAPLDERAAELSFTRGAVPAGATALLMRDGRQASASRDRLAELIATPELTLPVALLSLLVAIMLGAAHALSPGHGKAIVGAYLVGSRGTPRHALFLGITVTITHTLGVFALGLVTLFAAQYVVPERLFPVLSFISGAIVVGIGLSIFVRRLRVWLGFPTDGHAHPSDHTHEDEVHDELRSHVDAPTRANSHPVFVHSHDGGTPHSHLPPGAEGGRVTWRSLLALGVSGGLLPCPSALVVMLSAIALNRVAFGMLLVVTFSIGLAATLTGVGLAFLYAGRLMKRPMRSPFVTRVLPTLSAFVITCLGIVICYEALAQAGINPAALFAAGEETDLGSYSILSVLLLGSIFGLKHATEADHVVAVSTMVSEHRSILRAGLVGGMWGVGHTISLVVVGILVLALRVTIPESVASVLEFCVALMIVGLGVSVLVRALRLRRVAHTHEHTHENLAHSHIHFHRRDTQHATASGDSIPSHTHPVSSVGIKPVLVGAMHGLAGSGALTVLALTQIESIALGLLYLAVFGFGSILGMLLMSGLVGLPFALSARRLTGVNYGLQALAGVASIAFGLWYAYEVGSGSSFLTIIR